MQTSHAELTRSTSHRWLHPSNFTSTLPSNLSASATTTTQRQTGAATPSTAHLNLQNHKRPWIQNHTSTTSSPTRPQSLWCVEQTHNRHQLHRQPKTQCPSMAEPTFTNLPSPSRTSSPPNQLVAYREGEKVVWIRLSGCQPARRMMWLFIHSLGLGTAKHCCAALLERCNQDHF